MRISFHNHPSRTIAPPHPSAIARPFHSAIAPSYRNSTLSPQAAKIPSIEGHGHIGCGRMRQVQCLDLCAVGRGCNAQSATENSLPPEEVDQLLGQEAQCQSQRNLLFSTVVNLMSLVVVGNLSLYQCGLSSQGQRDRGSDMFHNIANYATAWDEPIVR